MKRIVLTIGLWSFVLVCAVWAFPSAYVFGQTGGMRCEPTPEDAPGPFYKPAAPLRASVGTGYVVSGRVLSAEDCSGLGGARIEFWLAGPDGRYSDQYRATIITSESGAYRFESHLPPPYGGRPRHIHIRVSGAGHQTLVTQHYPKNGETGATFDLVLRPAK